MLVCRHIERIRGLPYIAPEGEKSIGNAISKLMDRDEFAGAVLAVDQTGVGRAVIDILRTVLKSWMSPDNVAALTTLGVKGLKAGALLLPITFTDGHAVTMDKLGDIHVPKKDLCAAPLVQLEQGLLKVPTQPNSEILLKELGNFRIKVKPSGHETISAWREGEKDDLVLAMALASWASRIFVQSRFIIGLDLGQKSDYTALVILERTNYEAPPMRDMVLNGERVSSDQVWRINKDPVVPISVGIGSRDEDIVTMSDGTVVRFPPD